MASISRLSVAQRLDPLGLRTTLVAIKKDDIYTISRIRQITPTVELLALGEFSSDHVPCTGRVGISDPQIDFPWKNSMAFYGKWFDRISESRLKHQVYRNTPRICHQQMLEQIRRDNQYAVVGSYYSIFRTIIEAKRHVPLVLIDDSLLALPSFPVLLPSIVDRALEERLLNVLHRMLRLYPTIARSRVAEPPNAEGIDVYET